jgi:hypothetical protein
LPDNTVQGTTLRPWTIGVTVTQVLFNGYKTANNVRVAEFQVQSGREALRNVGQGVLLDAATAYMNVLANQALVEAQRTNVAVLREIQTTTKKRLDAGDVTPTDTAQAEARLSRGLADLNTAEVNLAISKADLHAGDRRSPIRVGHVLAPWMVINIQSGNGFNFRRPVPYQPDTSSLLAPCPGLSPKPDVSGMESGTRFGATELLRIAVLTA